MKRCTLLPTAHAATASRHVAAVKNGQNKYSAPDDIGCMSIPMVRKHAAAVKSGTASKKKKRTPRTTNTNIEFEHDFKQEDLKKLS